MQLRDFEEAERQFAKATALDPAAAEIWANRGNNQIALGRPDSALEFLTRALALEPNFPRRCTIGPGFWRMRGAPKRRSPPMTNASRELIALPRFKSYLADGDGP
jgi:tetratricopeptide (TPR) repeat protein